MGRGGAPSVSAYQWGSFGPGLGETAGGQGGGLDGQWEVLEELAQPLIVTPEVVLTLQVGAWVWDKVECQWWCRKTASTWGLCYVCLTRMAQEAAWPWTSLSASLRHIHTPCRSIMMN